MGWMTKLSRFDPQQRQKDFSSNLCVQTGSWAHPASCTMGTGGPLPGAKARPGRDSDPSPRSRVSRSYTPFPQVPSWHVVGLLYLYAFTVGCLMTEPSPIKVDQSLSWCGDAKRALRFSLLLPCLLPFSCVIYSISVIISYVFSTGLFAYRKPSTSSSFSPYSHLDWPCLFMFSTTIHHLLLGLLIEFLVLRPSRFMEVLSH
jgi:hypothetical protein